MAEVVSANPWLMGRMEGNQLSARLVYDEIGEWGGVRVEDVGIGRQEGCIGIQDKLKKVISAKKTFDLVCWECPDEEGTFGMAVAMNHGCGDGYSLYTIHAMLDPSAEIKPMEIANRTSDPVMEHCNPRGAYPPLPGFLRIIGLLVKMLYGAIVPWKVNRREGCYVISQEKINEIKNSTEGFLSTCDIVTSWWLNKFPGTSLRSFVVNLRGRLPKYNLTPLTAGNWVAQMNYSPTETITPEGIRHAVETRASGCPETVPCPPPISLYRWFFGTSSVVSNWATFYTTLHLPMCSQLEHLPVVLMPVVNPQNTAILYKSDENTQCVYVYQDPFLPIRVGTDVDELLKTRIR
eukprot:TRINITY_DN7113_c2_g2_i1.p1 TRINITY_DN7113_c2_g2~~TRINITY_DN7113_c2_g2_i1.p1  ORF type:complete len:399 (+),score=61.28 TRINITY_DN7113_c2_g2_i1:153-1199(+)